MKKMLQLLLLIFLTAVACPLGAKEKATVAVVPFSVHSADNIDYVRQGISDMLASRIAVEGKITVLGRDQVQEALKDKAGRDLTMEEINSLGKKLKADYIVSGSITKIGNSLSIDGKLIDIIASKSTVGIFTQTQGLDEVIPKMNDFAQRIVQQISGSAPSDFTSAAVEPTPPAASPATAAKQPRRDREAEIVSGMRSSKKGTFTSIINPDFIEGAQPLDRKGFWMSQKYPTEFRGMAIGDVNGDKLQEVVIIDHYNLYIYQRKDKDFSLIQKIPGITQDSYIAVDVADINQNGVAEIFVTSVKDKILNSFVMEYKDGKYVTTAKNIQLFLRVIEPSVSAPQLLGQRWGLDQTFNTPIHEIIWDGSQYRPANKMKIPQGLSVYGLALDDFGMGGSEKIVTLDDYDYLRIFQQSDKPLSKLAVFGGSEEQLYKSDEVFGGSNTYIDDINNPNPKDDIKRTYINLRILTYDMNKDGKKEIIIVRNTSSVGRVLQNVKLFTSSEVYNLEWDGLGLVENWKTRKINGYVCDYALKDIDNDGQNEVVLALVLSTGVAIQNRSALVSYKLSPPQ